MAYLLALLLIPSVAFSQTIPLKDFFKNSVETSHNLSPDGKNIAYLKSWESRMNIHVRALEGGSEKRISSLKDRDVAQFFWKGNDRLVYVRDFGGDENFHLFLVDLKSGEEKDITPYPKTRVEIVDALENINDDEMLISHNKRNPEVFDVYRVNLKNGTEKLVYQNPGNVTGYLTDHKGQLRVVLKSQGTDTIIMYRESEKASFSQIMSFDYTRSFGPMLFTADNKNLYVASNINRDKISVVEFDPRKKTEVKMVYQNPEYDVDYWGSSVVWSEKQNKILAIRYLTWKLQYAFFDKDFEDMFETLTEKFPTSNISVLSKTENEDKYTLSVSSDRNRGWIYIYDVKKKTLTHLIDTAPWLKAESLAEMKPVQYTARDGMVIHGYLTLPRGKSPKNLPVVVNPHGGPWARDAWRFNPEVQFLANRGYAVLQMNFRGSTGYGRRHLVASYKQWGRAMQDDITDGTNWLIDMGIADKKKICIYGGSYGGYATLMGLVKTPDLYACGVDYVGVSNLFTFLKTIPPYWKTEIDKLHAMVGHPVQDEAQYRETSPALNVNKIKAPLFVVQGAKDPRVNKAESDQVVESLRKRGVDVPYLVKDDEGHGFRNEENRFEFYGEMEKFLGKYLN